jgi:hypothetical protein
MQIPLFFGASTARALCATDIAKIFQRFSPRSSSPRLLDLKKMAHDSGDAFIHRSTMRASLEMSKARRRRLIEDAVGTKALFLTEIVWTTFSTESSH